MAEPRREGYAGLEDQRADARSGWPGGEPGASGARALEVGEDSSRRQGPAWWRSRRLSTGRAHNPMHHRADLLSGGQAKPLSRAPPHAQRRLRNQRSEQAQPGLRWKTRPRPWRTSATSR